MDKKQRRKLKKRDTWETVRYVETYEDRGGVMEPVYADVKVNKNHVSRYRMSLYALFRLSMCARHLIDYLSEVMDHENMVHNNVTVREQFIRFVDVATEGRVCYAASTVSKSIDQLCAMGFLTRHKRGTYMVNPIFFMRGGKERERVKLIRMVMEFSSTNTKFEIIRQLYTEVKP